MDLKVLSWNVEHFKGKPERIARIAGLIEAENPDVFGLIEVEGKVVFDEFTQRFATYSFSITEGPQSQEILIGWRHGLSAFVTQREEFKRSNPHLRPGALMTLTTPGGARLSILYAHLKSSPSPEGYGLRDAMFINVKSLKSALDKAAGAQEARFILLGDLNTMGMELSYSDKDQTGAEEIARIEKVLKVRGLHNQPRTHDTTWNNGSASSYAPSALDHVFATANLTFEDQGGGKTVKVGGWAEKATPAEQDAWIASFSDHAPITFRLLGL